MDARGPQFDDRSLCTDSRTFSVTTGSTSVSERQRTYSSPMAFRRALTDKLKVVAETSRWNLPQLQRQMAYDRFLERLYLVDDGWVVKGATALLAREIGVRATIDVDVYRAVERQAAEADIGRAADLDIGDWFRFDIGPARAHSDGAAGVRFPVTAYVGATEWAQFHVDLVGSNLRMTGEPDEMPALARIVMPDVAQHGYRVYPLVDHVADKVVAIIERHGDRPSTRFKDLVDLVAIITEASVDAKLQRTALQSEATRRGIILPNRFDVPDRELWKTGYESEAQRSLLPLAQTLDEALAIVRPFVDALLDETPIDHWDPTTLQWSRT
jgi:hypothetical protein